MTTNGSPLLGINNIEVIYDHVILVLKGVSLEVSEGASLPSSEPTGPEKQPP